MSDNINDLSNKIDVLQALVVELSRTNNKLCNDIDGLIKKYHNIHRARPKRTEVNEIFTHRVLSIIEKNGVISYGVLKNTIRTRPDSDVLEALDRLSSSGKIKIWEEFNASNLLTKYIKII